jgi:CHAT domain-containing protein
MNIRLCYLLIFFLSVSSAYAQEDKKAVAERLYNEASQLLVQNTAESKQKALEKFQTALPIFRELGMGREEGATLNDIGLVYSFNGDKRKAIEYYDQALPLRRAAGDRQGEARTLQNTARAYDDLGVTDKAIDYFNQALDIFKAIGDRQRVALTLNGMGVLYSRLGEFPKAIQVYNESLQINRELGNKQGEAILLSNIGAVYGELGEYQRSFEFYNQSLPLRRSVGDRKGEAMTLNHIAGFYAKVGMLQQSLDYLGQALPLMRTVGDRFGEAFILHNTGVTYLNMGEFQKGLQYLEEALPIRKSVGDRRGEANTLEAIGSYYFSLKNYRKAIEYFDQILPLWRSTGDRSGEGSTLRKLGMTNAALGETKKAIDYLDQALPLLRAVGDRRDQAETLYGIASVQRDSDNLDDARVKIEEAISIIESLRANIPGQELRASYFATVQQYYQFYIDLLLRLHRSNPKAGLQALALHASERARARSLLELLSEARADIRQGVDPKLIERERGLQQRINSKAARLLQLKRGRSTPDQIAALEKEIDLLTAEFGEVKTLIKQKSPRYAALTEPQPLKLDEIQRTVLDPDTLLLEYSLGEERSFVWAVTPTSIDFYELPGRSQIEGLAERVYRSLTARNGRYASNEEKRARITEAEVEFTKAAAGLSEMLLGPVSAHLKARRLLVVGDGALQYIPLAALPLPGRKGIFIPLVAEHEIVSLPSASIIAVLRQETDGRKPAERALAVFADPVFDRSDPRVRESMGASKDRAGKEAVTVAARSYEELERSILDVGKDAGGAEQINLPRLISTREEAEAITGLVPSSERRVALGFEAGREVATSEEIERYRIVHFASHGLLNSSHPELSGIVLSLVDEQGQMRDGFLRLHDIYNLKLPAELVVLSACQTGLGKEIKGEGLIGLTRGFMYAGAARVVASLWKVDDEATAELMKRFYNGMLKEGETAASALRKAQIGMWKQKRWQSPFYWAAFVLQGEYK